MTRSKPSKSKRKKPKLFVVRKFIMAKSVQDALKKEPKRLPDDCFLHNGWEQQNVNELESAVGFNIESQEDND